MKRIQNHTGIMHLSNQIIATSHNRFPPISVAEGSGKRDPENFQENPGLVKYDSIWPDLFIVFFTFHFMICLQTKIPCFRSTTFESSSSTFDPKAEDFFRLGHFNPIWLNYFPLSLLLLMAEILHHLGCMKPYK